MQFLEKLIDTPSPSGFEQPVQAVFEEYVSPFVDEIRRDVHGNVMAIKNPDASFRLMLCAHCDEVGMMVISYDEDGFLHLMMIGDVGGGRPPMDPNMLPGQRVNIHTRKGPIPGVIGRKPGHMSREGDTVKVEELTIDIGAKDKKDAKRAVEVGDPVTFAVGLQELRNNNAAGRAFDDKAGVYAIAEAMRLVGDACSKDVAVYAVSTVQEEIGIRGAVTSAYTVEPHVAIAVDQIWATDCVGMSKHKFGEVLLGRGPVIFRGPNMNSALFGLLMKAARKRKIPYQVSGWPIATGTDINPIQLSRGGVVTGLLMMPNRYSHTPVEVNSLDDMDSTAKLFAAFMKDLDPKTDFTP